MDPHEFIPCILCKNKQKFHIGALIEHIAIQHEGIALYTCKVCASCKFFTPAYANFHCFVSHNNDANMIVAGSTAICSVKKMRKLYDNVSLCIQSIDKSKSLSCSNNGQQTDTINMISTASSPIRNVSSTSPDINNNRRADKVPLVPACPSPRTLMMRLFNPQGNMNECNVATSGDSTLTDEDLANASVDNEDLITSRNESSVIDDDSPISIKSLPSDKQQQRNKNPFLGIGMEISVGNNVVARFSSNGNLMNNNEEKTTSNFVKVNRLMSPHDSIKADIPNLNSDSKADGEVKCPPTTDLKTDKINRKRKRSQTTLSTDLTNQCAVEVVTLD